MGVKRTMERARPQRETRDALLQKFLQEKRSLNKSKDTIRGYRERVIFFLHLLHICNVM